MATLKRDIAHKLATLPALPTNKQNTGRGSHRSCRERGVFGRSHISRKDRVLIAARPNSRTRDAHDAKTAIRNAKEAVQKHKFEARRSEKRLRRAQKRLEKLQPKDKHSRIRTWLGLSDDKAMTTPSVPEARPPFDDKGFPIPNQHWVTADKASLVDTAVSAKTKEYYRAGGKRMPSTDEAVDRERAKKKRKREEAAK